MAIHAHIRGAILTGLLLAGHASGQSIPACPAGSTLKEWQGPTGAYVHYQCELPQTMHGMKMCVEPRADHWDTSASLPCGSRISSMVRYTGPLKCSITKQVYLLDNTTGKLSKDISCLPDGWIGLMGNEAGCPAGFTPGSPALVGQDLCYGRTPSALQRDLVSHDINGFRLGMTFKEVQEHAGESLRSLTSTDYEATVDKIHYSFGFSIRGHLYRIDSTQYLGRFIPDAEYGRVLTEKLTAKYGPPQSNQLPDGPAFWEYLEPYNLGNGLSASRTTLSLSAILMPGWNQPVALELKLMDFRIMRNDVAAANSGPRSRAEKATQF